MPDARPQHPSQRMSFQAVRLLLVAVAIASAIAAGCGGAKHPADDAATRSAAANDSSTPPPAATPASADKNSPPATSKPVPSAPVAGRPRPVTVPAPVPTPVSVPNPVPVTTPAPVPTPVSVPNPAPVATPTPVAEGSALGAQLFAKRCVLCHGVDGHGDGVASKGLNPRPRNFHDQAYMKTRTDAQLLEVIRKGKGVMPRWENQLSEAEIQTLLKHVRALGTKP